MGAPTWLPLQFSLDGRVGCAHPAFCTLSDTVGIVVLIPSRVVLVIKRGLQPDARLQAGRLAVEKDDEHLSTFTAGQMC